MKVPKARKLKSGTWFIQLRLGGESIPVTGKTERECVKQAEYIKSQYLVGKREKPQAPAPDPPEPKKLPTLGEAVDAYIARRDKILSPSTIRGYKTIRRTRFKSTMTRCLGDIEPYEWQMICNEEAYICSPRTLKNSWGLLVSAVLDVTGAHLPKVKLPQIPDTDLPFLEPEHIDPFIKAVHGTDVEIPALLALSSLRRSEIMAVRWENVDIEKKLIYVRGAAVMDSNNRLVQRKENKNDTSRRTVPILMDELYDELKKGKATHSDGLVVSCMPNTVWSRITHICKDNNFPLVGVHGLRRSFVSLAYHIGLDEDLTMEIGGWNDTQTMRKHYKRLAKSDIRKQTGKLLNFFRKIAPVELTAAEAAEILTQQRELFRLNSGEEGNSSKIMSAYTMAIAALSPKDEEKPAAS